MQTPQQTQEITFPKNWNKLTIEEQKQWIQTYFTPNTEIPEQYRPQPFPIEFKDLSIEGKTKSGIDVKVGTIKNATIKRYEKNPNLVREYEAWVDKWLITVFHDRKTPATKFIAISNPQTEKWIAQELSNWNWRKLQAIILSIGRKYRIVQRKNLKSKRKKPHFTLSLSNEEIQQ